MRSGPKSSRLPLVSEFDVVAFDVYGTLFDITGERWAAPEVVATMRSKQLQYSWLVSLMGDYRPFSELTRAAVEHALEVHGASADVDAVMDGMLRIKPYPETVGVLERLRAHARLAVLSNGDTESLEALLQNTGVRELFDLVISAAEVRIFKPAPAVYQLLLDKSRAGRDRVLFVSSNGFDVAGAARFGLRVAWVNRRGSPPEGVGGRPEFAVKDLTELAALVG
jgi:2-haloacid dehalogenase